MKKLFVVLWLVLVANPGWAGIPDTTTHKWGVMRVPEDYSNPGGRTIKMYWEKLRSTSPVPQAIVLINGGPGFTHDSFHNQFPDGSFGKDWFDALRSDFDIYYFDQRGTGHSNPLKSSMADQTDFALYRTENICRDIEEFRKTVIGKDRIAILGESYGGMVALTYATMFPDSISKLVVHDSSPSNDYYLHMHRNFSEGIDLLDTEIPGVKANFQTTLQRIDQGGIVTFPPIPLDRNIFLCGCMPLTYRFESQKILGMMVEELARTGQSRIMNSLASAGFFIPVSQLDWDHPVFTPVFTTLLVQALEMHDEAAIPAFANEPPCSPYDLPWLEAGILRIRRGLRNDLGLQSFFPYDLTRKLGSIRVPTLMIVGKHDMVTPARYAFQIRDGIPACGLMVLEGAGHGGFIEQNETVVPAIRNFLLGIEAPAPNFSVQMVGSPKPRSRRKYPSPKEIVDAYREGIRMMGSF